MAIETLEDWNDQVTSFGQEGCGCCAVPGQDGIGYIGESLLGNITIQGWSDAGNLYLTKTVSYSGGGSSVQTYDSAYGCSLGGTTIEALGAITIVDTAPLTGTPTVTYSDLIDVSAELIAGRSAVEGAIDWVGMTKSAGSGAAYYESLGLDTYRSISFSRIKFRKADYALSNPPGSYLKLTFDTIDFLEDTSESIFASNEVLEWTGTFDINDQENSSHFTSFHYIDPPTQPGGREMRNLNWTRFQSTRYGNKPQISFYNGDVFTGIFGPYP